MKHLICSLLTLVAAVPALAGPLQKNDVAADAKWILHLDVDQMRATQVGDAIVRQRIDKEMGRVRADLKTYLDYDFDWTRIHGLTAYGMDYQRRGKAKGVLLIHTDLDVQRGLEAAIEKQGLAGVPDGNVQRLQAEPVPWYSIREELFVALPAGKPIVLAKSRDLVDKGVSVLAGTVPSTAAGSAFSEFGPVPTTGFFLAMAEGLGDQTPLPPQAKVLRMTDAGRFMIGESNGQVALSLLLKAKSPEISLQIQQVLQGLMALVTLGQVDNPELQRLAQSTRVMTNDRWVTVDVQLPVGAVLQKMAEKHAATR